jgi:hypothetical protein
VTSRPHLAQPLSTDDVHDLLFGPSLRQIATGGEHIVYASDQLQGVVAKVSSNTLRAILRRGERIDSPSAATLDTLRHEEVHEHERRMVRLRSHFGGAHTLDERRHLLSVPLTRDLLDLALGGRPSYLQELHTLGNELSHGTLSTTWAVVTIQPYLPILARQVAGGRALSLVGGYSDDGTKADRQEAALYWRVTHALVLSGKPLDGFDRGEFLRVQTRPELAILVAALENDVALRDTLRVLLIKIYSYVVATGEILDTAGPGNIVFARSDSSWDYILVDALSIHNERVLDTARAAVAALAVGSQITGRERLLLMKALNFLRTVNGLGACVGLGSDVFLSPQEGRIDTIDFLRETRDLVPR